MKRKTQKLLLSMVSLFVFVMALTLSTTAAQAAKAKAPVCPKTATVYYAYDYENNVDFLDGYVFIKNLKSNAKITDIKSTNKKIKAAFIHDVQSLKPLGILIQPSEADNESGYYKYKNTEKSTISFKVRQNGKTYKFKVKVTLKLISPITSLKIGGKDYTKQIKNRTYVELETPPFGDKKVKLQAKANKNFKITGFTVVYNDMDERTVKNGASVSLKDVDYILVNYKYKKLPKYCPKTMKHHYTIKDVLVDFD